MNINNYKNILTNKVQAFKGLNTQNNLTNNVQPLDKDSVTIDQNKLQLQKYLKLREEISPKYDQLRSIEELTAWDFYINSTDANLQRYTKAQKDFSEFFKDKEIYNKLKDFETLETEDKHLKKQIKNITKAFYNEIESGEELKALRDKENEIASKYNSYVLKIDDKPVSKAEISKILETEKDVELRKKAYQAKVSAGDFIADDLVKLVKMRNEYAKTKGYDNYFDYMLEEQYDITPQTLDKLLNRVYSKIIDKFIELSNKSNQDLAKEFGIEIDDLQDYHYGLLTSNTPQKKVNDYLETKEKVVDIAKQTYKNMGYDIDKMNITLDLFPRENKNTHCFAFSIKAGEDTRILANLTNNINSIDSLLHELGHCVYDMGIDKNLPVLEQKCVSPAMTEAIAMMMGDLPYCEDILKDTIPTELLYELKQELAKEDANFLTRSLQIINFEKQMYKNPDQDLKQLWKNITQRYRNSGDNTSADNSWATIPHYLSHPGYYQNYFRALLLKAQIYETLKSELGELTQNTNTAKVLKEKLFKLGSSKTEEEIVKELTGKELSENDFCNRIIK